MYLLRYIITRIKLEKNRRPNLNFDNIKKTDIIFLIFINI